MNHDAHHASGPHTVSELEHAVHGATDALQRVSEVASAAPDLTAAQVGKIGAQLIELAAAAVRLAMHFTEGLAADLAALDQTRIADRRRLEQ